MNDLVEKVAQRIAANKRGWPTDHPDLPRVSTAYFGQSRAAIAQVLDQVEAHLSAVQYDPAPYTAMKYRLTHLRKEAGIE